MRPPGLDATLGGALEPDDFCREGSDFFFTEVEASFPASFGVEFGERGSSGLSKISLRVTFGGIALSRGIVRAIGVDFALDDDDVSSDWFS